MSAKHPPTAARGLDKISASQFLIFLLAVLCLVIIYSAYQSYHAPAVQIETTPPVHDRTQLRLTKNIAQWKASLAKRNITLACPYLNHDYVARIDLPEQRAITLDAWDYSSETKIAAEAYQSFVAARRSARVAEPESCLVHVFDSSGEEVVQASQQGIVTSQYEPIPGNG